jgi:hypothetical protein
MVNQTSVALCGYEAATHHPHETMFERSLASMAASKKQNRMYLSKRLAISDSVALAVSNTRQLCHVCKRPQQDGCCRAAAFVLIVQRSQLSVLYKLKAVASMHL